MKPLDKLINNEDPGCTMVKEWIATATNSVEILPVNLSKAAEALYKTQVTTRSPMGAVVYNTGGILIDNGWIRILGSGSEKLRRTLPDWNKGRAFKEFGDVAPFYLIADDAAGGFFLLNGSMPGKEAGEIYYLAPDTLEYESLGMGYSDFLNFCFSGNLTKFYEGLQWKTWKQDITALKGDQAYSFYPYLWTKQGKDIEKVLRKAIPITELYSLAIDLRKQMGLD